MKNDWLLCGASALLGAGAMFLTAHFESVLRAQAQPPRALPLQRLPSGDWESGQSAIGVPDIPDHLTPEERVNIAVYENVHRSVVHINTKGVYHDYESFFSFEVPAEGSGSGSVLDREGHILTNFHVVQDAQQIEVTLANGKPYAARLVGHDVLNDVAVLKIDAPSSELHPIDFGQSGSLRVGQRVFALGSPFQLERTFTTGIISSLNRTLPSRSERRIMKAIIQIDAAMNPGNSGGPLLDTSGRVIGMNTAIASRTGQNTGVGFAIPVDRIKRVVPDLIRYGKLTRPDAGITRVVIVEQGILIHTVAPGGPAEQAGLRGIRIVRKVERHGFLTIERRAIDLNSADIITAVDGQPVHTWDDFLSQVESHKPGEEVVFSVLRGGRVIEVPVTLGAGES